jgi:hypothetical protein
VREHAVSPIDARAIMMIPARKRPPKEGTVSQSMEDEERPCQRTARLSKTSQSEGSKEIANGR